MPRSGGRLNLMGALNRNVLPSQLTPLSVTAEPDSKHASVCRLERELKTVKQENNMLKQQLEETRSALKQITSEASLENFDERRVNMLKMQIIQLQRQVLLMSEALGSRSTALMEVENALTWLSEKFRYYIGVDVKGPDVPVLRSDLITMVDTSESARIKLFKSVENCCKENTSQPQMMMNPFLKPGLDKENTILDCCLGDINSLNLKHVGQLESKLSSLYKELIKVSEYLNGQAAACQTKDAGHMGSAIREREGTVILRACAMSRDCAASLLSLSLLFPSAPWPALKKPAVSEVTYEALACSLPPLPHSKAAEVQRCVTAALKACNHRCHMLNQEAGALREEVRFHQEVYQLQLDYIQQVFDALRLGYNEFELSTNEIVVQPLKKLMEAYTKLKNNTSQDGLREFLTILKAHENQWAETIERLDSSEPHHQSGAEAISTFGKEFFGSLDRMVLARQIQRDCASSQKEELKSAQRRLEEELRCLLRDGEEQRKNTTCLKGKDSEVDSSACTTARVNPDVSVEYCIKSSSHVPDKSGGDSSEIITGLRPWLDDSNPSPPSSDRNKGKLIHPKPWQPNELETHRSDVTENSERSKIGLYEESEFGSGLRPWLGEPFPTEKRQTGKSRTLMKKRNKADPVNHDTDVDALAYSKVQGHRSATNASDHDGSQTRSGTPQDYSDNNCSARLAGSSQSLRKHSFQGDAGTSPDGTGSDRQPLSFSSTSKCPPSGPTKGKSQARPSRNYEPKLYVTNRTLSLRRAGSLTKLSTPSSEEQRKKMTVASPAVLDSFRETSTRQNDMK